MLRPLQSPDVADTNWLDPFVKDFRGRFMSLLAGRCAQPATGHGLPAHRDACCCWQDGTV